MFWVPNPVPRELEFDRCITNLSQDVPGASEFLKDIEE